VDIKTRRLKQQEMMARMVERKVRSRAQQLYENRGHADGHELQDWFQAESEVLGKSILAPLYRRLIESKDAAGQNSSMPSRSSTDAPCEGQA